MCVRCAVHWTLAVCFDTCRAAADQTFSAALEVSAAHKERETFDLLTVFMWERGYASMHAIADSDCDLLNRLGAFRLVTMFGVDTLGVALKLQERRGGYIWAKACRDMMLQVFIRHKFVHAHLAAPHRAKLTAAAIRPIS